MKTNFVVTKSKQPAIRATVVSGSRRGVGAPPIATYAAFLPERDEFKDRCKALMLVKQCIL